MLTRPNDYDLHDRVAICQRVQTRGAVSKPGVKFFDFRGDIRGLTSPGILKLFSRTRWCPPHPGMVHNFFCGLSLGVTVLLNILKLSDWSCLPARFFDFVIPMTKEAQSSHCHQCGLKVCAWFFYFEWYEFGSDPDRWGKASYSASGPSISRHILFFNLLIKKNYRMRLAGITLSVMRFILI